MLFGIGAEAEYVRSANLINVISNYISGAVGGKPPNNTAEDIYPQLSYSDKPLRGGNNLVKWERTDERMRQQLIAAGLFTEDGDPIANNPHGKR